MGLFGKKDVKVIFSSHTDEELRQQAAKHYAERKKQSATATPKKFKDLTPQERDRQWQEYGEQSKKYIKDKNYGFYRNTRYDMAMHLKKEDNQSGVLALLTEVIFWDLTGCDNQFDYKNFIEITMGLKMGKRTGFLFPYENSIMKLAPGVIREVGICQNKLGYTDEQLKSEMLKNLQNMTAPVQFFTCEEIVNIFFWERDKNLAQLKKVYAAAKKRFDPKRPNDVSNN